MSHPILIDETSQSEYALGADITLGRGRRCDIRLDAPQVEREHATIGHFGSGFAIRAIAAKAEVLVNDEPVSGQRQLEQGDRIRIGQTTLRVALGDAFGPPVEADTHRGAVPPPLPAHPPAGLPAEDGERSLALEFAPQHVRRRRMRRSAATRGWATLICFAIVLADAIAVSIYLAGN